jgi:solute carrier family 10 (sodium/bile acid cotransporter), member 7
MKLFDKIKAHWFAMGLGLVFLMTIGDITGTVARAGAILRSHHGPDVVIVFIFFCSGLMLDAGQARSGTTDFKGLVLALALIFIVSPAVAAGFGLLPLSREIIIGIFLVAAMPTTLSSGVVMTGASGGNMAHALLITISANCLSVLTIPVVLSGLLSIVGHSTVVTFAKLPVMIKIAYCVLIPLTAGSMARYFFRSAVIRMGRRLSILNQLFILCIVWMSLSQSRGVILANGNMTGSILGVVFSFHLILMMLALLTVSRFGIEPGRKESVVFMGVQKTLPLSVILQVSLFPDLGMVLVVCVVHHVVHLMMDGLLVGRFAAAHHRLAHRRSS